MDHDTKTRTILLLLDGSRLLSMGILHQQHHDIDELLANDNIHTKVRYLRDSRRISDDHFHLLFPSTDVSRWDATISSRFLNHCIDLEEPQRKIMNELNQLRIKGMEMYQEQGMSDEECLSVSNRIVKILEKGKTLFTGPILRVIDKTMNHMKQTPVTPEDKDRVNNWYYLETKYEGTDTGYGDTTERRSLVHDAAYHGKLTTLKYISKEFPDRLLERDKDGNQAVHFAAEGGHIECLIFIFESFPDLQMARNEDGFNALHCAACGGSLDCLTYLLNQGMTMDTRSLYGSTILHEAAFKGSLSVVQYICRTFPALKNEETETGMNALFRAVLGGSLDCVKYLISQGLNTETRCKNRNTLLHTAAYGGSVPMIQYIWETFPELNKEKNDKGQDALFSAVLGGSLDCVKYMISQGMNIDTRSTDGNTLLHSAAYGGSLDCVKYLISQGMNIDTRSTNGNTLLHSATYGGSLDCVKYLIDQGLITYGRYTDICEKFPDLINERNQKGQMCLHSAIRGGSLECVKYLIGQGMKIDSRSKYGDTILHQAAFDGNEGVVRYLCDNYPQLLSYKKILGQTPLFSAINGGHLDILKFLLSQIDPKQRDKNGKTILHAAAWKGKTDIVSYLCTSYTFLIDMTSFKGETAIQLARRNGHFECVRMIQERL